MVKMESEANQAKGLEGSGSSPWRRRGATKVARKSKTHSPRSPLKKRKKAVDCGSTPVPWSKSPWGAEAPKSGPAGSDQKHMSNIPPSEQNYCRRCLRLVEQEEEPSISSSPRHSICDSNSVTSLFCPSSNYTSPPEQDYCPPSYSYGAPSTPSSSPHHYYHPPPSPGYSPSSSSSPLYTPYSKPASPDYTPSTPPLETGFSSPPPPYYYTPASPEYTPASPEYTPSTPPLESGFSSPPRCYYTPASPGYTPLPPSPIYISSSTPTPESSPVYIWSTTPTPESSPIGIYISSTTPTPETKTTPEIAFASPHHYQHPPSPLTPLPRLRLPETPPHRPLRLSYRLIFP